MAWEQTPAYTFILNNNNNKIVDWNPLRDDAMQANFPKFM